MKSPSIGLAAALIALGCTAAAHALPVEVTLTADNHYALFTGDEDGITLTLIGNNELGAGGGPGTYNWSLAESYSFDTDDDYIYIVAWSDDHVAQGVLAAFTIDGTPVLSGDPAWEVFATDLDLDDGSAVPASAAVGAQISLANSSNGWETPALGGTNGVAPWGTIAGIDSAARWMWRLAPDQIDAFAPGNDHGEYLIFRLPLGGEVPEPGTLALLLFAVPLLRPRAIRSCSAPSCGD